jgi:hypothetical protein
MNVATHRSRPSPPCGGELERGEPRALQLRLSPLPNSSPQGAIAYGFALAIALEGKTDSEDDSRIMEGVGCRSSGRPFGLLSQDISPKRLLYVTRSHWSSENQLHWVLDVHFAEDGNRARKDNAPENLAVLRRLALNILRAHPDRKSIRLKIRRAGWDDAFLMQVLSHMR